MPLDLAAEYEAPAKVAPPDLSAEFEPPPREEQHAVINDAAEKAHQFKQDMKIAFGEGVPSSKEEQTAAARRAFSGILDSFGSHIVPETKKTLTESWEGLNTNLINLPQAPEVPEAIAGAYPQLPIIAGAYNGAAKVASGLTSPLSIATLGTFGALSQLAAQAGRIGTAAKVALRLVQGGFAAQMAKSTGEAAGRASVSAGKSAQQQATDVVDTLASGAMTALAAKGAAEPMEPSGRGPATNPNAVDEAINRKTDQNIAAANERLAKPAPAEFLGIEGEGSPKAFEVYRLNQDIEGHPKGSSVSRKTLEDAGYTVPEAPKPDLAQEFEAPAPDTEAHQVITGELAKNTEQSSTAEPVNLASEVTPPENITGIRNAVVDQERASRGLPPAMEEAARGFGKVWDDAMKRLDEDPAASADLVRELNTKPRAITDVEDALLTHRQVDLQNQFDKMAESVVDGAEGQSSESVAEAKVKLAKLSDDLLDVYNADKAGGRETARGLSARRMMVAEDFSLAKMIVRRRAVNEGRPLTEEQSQQVKDLHEKITATQKAFDDYVARTEERLKKMESTRSGTRNTDKNVVSRFIDEQADAARKRIRERERSGILYTGLPLDAAADYAIVGAQLLKNGIVDAAEWGNKMVDEFGDHLKPHLGTILQKAKDNLDSAKTEGTRLKSFKTRAVTREESYKERLAEEDFGPREKREPIRLDEEGQKLKAAADRAKGEFQSALIEDRLKNRTSFEKVQDTLVKWRRGFLLSGLGTLQKLTGAALLRGVQTPIEEGIGAAISKVAPGVAEKAAREGYANVDAEAAAITGAFMRGLNDSVQILKTGKSDLEVLHGKKSENVRESDIVPRSVIDYFGSLHSALKAPIKRAEFERSFEKRMAAAIKAGADGTDPMVQTKIATEAYKDANRAIFMQDNVVTDAYQAGISRLLKRDKEGAVSPAGKVVATTARLLLPIVKIPTNLVAETFEIATGSVTGSAKLAKAIHDGTEKLTPEQADIIMRQLKKGSLGLALLALGYFNPENVGGYYQQGEKRKKDDAKAASLKLYGQDIPSILIHNPAIEVLQLGATIRRVVDSKHKGQSPSMTEAIGEALMGLGEEVPFIRTPIELAKIADKNTRTKAVGDLTRSFVVPELVQGTARFLDKDAAGNPIKRNPKTVLENVETGIPGLRETVRRK